MDIILGLFLLWVVILFAIKILFKTMVLIFDTSFSVMLKVGWSYFIAFLCIIFLFPVYWFKQKPKYRYDSSINSPVIIDKGWSIQDGIVTTTIALVFWGCVWLMVGKG